MTTVRVRASKTYEVRIGENLLLDTGKALRELSAPCRVCILSDDTVFPLYGERVKRSLSEAGFFPEEYVIKSGEASKDGRNYLAFLEFLAEKAYTRSDLLVALGGGVPGDLCGFAAATYLRGIGYVQLPTSILAMVDSSVGGKTAIDLAAGKNQCGAFYQPSLVLCSTDTALTLPAAVYADGMAEVIKYAMIGDADLFSRLSERKIGLEETVARCVSRKRDLVEADEFDENQRQLLNFGHTPAHAIETLSGYTVPHGRAVAMGMAVITRAAEAHGLCEKNTAKRLTALLKTYFLPQESPYGATLLAEAARHDKKCRGEKLTLVIPEKIGKAVLLPIPVSDYESFLMGGTE